DDPRKQHSVIAAVLRRNRQIRESQRKRARAAVHVAAKQHEGIEIFLPHADELKDRDRHQPRSRERKQHAPERREFTAAVDDRGFIKRTRKRPEESREDKNRERQSVRRVHEDQSQPRVEQAEFAQFKEERHHRQLSRNHQPGEKQPENEPTKGMI